LIYLDIHYELTSDLQRILDEDLTLLQQQIETLKLEQIYNNLKTIYERIEKSQSINQILTLPFFTGPNASFGISILLNKQLIFSIDMIFIRFRNSQTSC